MQIYILVLWMVILEFLPWLIGIIAAIAAFCFLSRARWRPFWICVMLLLSSALFIVIYG